MNSIKMNRLELLEIVRKNKTIHEQQFEEAKNDYVVAMNKIAEENVKIARFNAKSIAKYVNAKLKSMVSWIAPPTSYSAEYGRAIRMLELSVEDVIEVEEDIFNQLVLDEWGWKKQFIATSTMYKTMSGSQ